MSYIEYDDIPEDADYPEHKKMEKEIEVQDATQQVGQFFDSQEYFLCTWNDKTEQHERVRKTPREIAAMIFDIDTDKVEKETKKMVEEVRESRK